MELTLKNLFDGNFYHLCTEGLEAEVIVRDNEDFRVACNYIALAAWRTCVFIVAFCVMSNHFHILSACKNRDMAERFLRLFKQMYATYLHNKYHMKSPLKGVSDSVSLITDINYLRKCIAYILRNPICAKICLKVEDYPWSSYPAYFNTAQDQFCHSVQSLKGRRRRQVLRSAMDVEGCPYMVEEDGNITLESFVRSDIVEAAFKHSGRYFLYQLGSCNDARMEYEMVVKPLVTSDDQELLRAAQKRAAEYYPGHEFSDLSVGERCAMLKNLFFNNKTTVPQLARVLGLPRSLVRKILST